MVNKNKMLINFTLRSFTLGNSVVRSTSSFIVIAMSVVDVALMVKNLQGNQSLRCRKPWKTSAAIARVQMRDATATYNPINSMAIASNGYFVFARQGKISFSVIW
ncbi:hypothetical protein L6452_29115 [Arctium lappa]|uniref:Uncharacterized protein n=1 Tax=Arctium lappa TaxID=4217 RepID=A0ACB8ZGQ1_ARCLA|nr:hypothetical protein L6452_29115 [Arctium lappa]